MMEKPYQPEVARYKHGAAGQQAAPASATWAWCLWRCELATVFLQSDVSYLRRAPEEDPTPSQARIASDTYLSLIHI